MANPDSSFMLTNDIKKIFLKHWFMLTCVFLVMCSFAIRLYKVESNPPSLYWEEVALGYDALSIALTGKDHHGAVLPLIAFESFGDWKPSLYFYTLVPYIKLFGLSEHIVRLPSVIAGTLLVACIGWLSWLVAGTLEIQKKGQLLFQQQAALLAVLLSAVSPWLIFFSRAGWEVNLATTLLTAGCCFFLYSLSKKPKPQITYQIVSVVLLSASMYAYHAARLVAPLLGVGLVLVWFNTFSKGSASLLERVIFFLKKKSLVLLLLGVLSIIFLLPFLSHLGSPELTQRLNETTIFNDGASVEKSNYYRGLNDNSIVSRLVYHRYLFYGQEITKNFLSHFDLQFLFLSGDKNPRHSSQYFGLLYYLDGPLLLLGLVFLIKKRNSIVLFLGFWVCVGIFPAAISLASPHALRILISSPIWYVVLSMGSVSFFNFWKKYFLKRGKVLKAFIFICIVLYLGQFLAFERYYGLVYPTLYSSEWQYGYKQMVASLVLQEQAHPDLPVYISRIYGRPAMYYWFFTQTDPSLVQEVNASTPKDQGEFLSFGSKQFVTALGEMKEFPALVAAQPEDLSNFIKDHSELQLETKDIILNVSGKSIWTVAIIQRLNE